jgi:hypothetical protein
MLRGGCRFQRNLVFLAMAMAGGYRLRAPERFALDARLHPPG